MTTALLVGNSVVLVLVILLVVGLLRSHAAILRRLHDLDGGDDGSGRSTGLSIDRGPAPQRVVDPAMPQSKALTGVTLGGESVVIATTDVRHDSILAFLTSGCLTCREFWAAFAGPDGVTLPARTRLVIVTKDLSEESPSELFKLAPRDVELVASSQAWLDYEVPGSPYVIAVEGATGQIKGEGTGMSWEQVAGLLAQATGDRSYVVGSAGTTVTKPSSDVEREARVDRELLSAGVLPGDPSLYPDQGDASPETTGENNPL